MPPPIDLPRLAEFSDGTDAGLRALIELFLQDSAETAAELHAAVAAAQPRWHGCDMKRILIIDDNQMLANVSRASLAGAGFAVEVAHDGESEVAAARRRPLLETVRTAREATS